MKRYPELIVEVMSSSTEAFDRTNKFQDYQNLNSFEEYVLIAQDKMQIECRRRVKEHSDQPWETVFYTKGDRLILQSISLEIAVEELYRGTSLAI